MFSRCTHTHTLQCGTDSDQLMLSVIDGARVNVSQFHLPPNTAKINVGQRHGADKAHRQYTGNYPTLPEDGVRCVCVSANIGDTRHRSSIFDDTSKNGRHISDGGSSADNYSSAPR